eukprot:1143124-Pelagomonas_calceolata.AAC.5
MSSCIIHVFGGCRMNVDIEISNCFWAWGRVYVVSGNGGPKVPEGHQRLGMGSFLNPIPGGAAAEGRGQSVQVTN